MKIYTNVSKLPKWIEVGHVVVFIRSHIVKGLYERKVEIALFKGNARKWKKKKTHCMTHYHLTEISSFNSSISSPIHYFAIFLAWYLLLYKYKSFTIFPSCSPITTNGKRRKKKKNGKMKTLFNFISLYPLMWVEQHNSNKYPRSYRYIQYTEIILYQVTVDDVSFIHCMRLSLFIFHLHQYN